MRLSASRPKPRKAKVVARQLTREEAWLYVGVSAGASDLRLALKVARDHLRRGH